MFDELIGEAGRLKEGFASDVDIASAAQDFASDIWALTSEAAGESEIAQAVREQLSDPVWDMTSGLGDAWDTTVEGGDEVVEAIAGEADEVTESYEYIICRNESLAGDCHPMTGVPFERKTVTLESGKVVEGVFAQFDSTFDAKIAKELYESSNVTQFKECNRQLYAAIQENPELRAQFSDELIEQTLEGCSTGQAPDGFVWHHNEAEGVIQLVDRATHEATGHTGGRAIWGGGY